MPPDTPFKKHKIMCCEKNGNFTYIAYASDSNGSDFNLSRTADGIKRCWQAIYVSETELDVTQATFPNFFYKRWFNICQSSNQNTSNGFGESLPTPMIAKRKTSFPVGITRKTYDSITNRLMTRTDLESFSYDENYYKEKFDIYFNSFGNRNWLSMPDLRLEIVLVSNKNSKREKLQNGDISGRGNKDYVTNSLIHPANVKLGLVENIKDTIFSGGNGGISRDGSGNLVFDFSLKQTEWGINISTNNIGGIYGGNKNKLNNPNITVEIDVRDLFKVYDTTPGASPQKKGVSYPHCFNAPIVGSSLVAGPMFVKSIGKIKYKNTNNKVFKRNSVFFFRLSCGVPGTEDGGVYKKRLYSDLSLPVYIKPKIARFYDVLNEYLGFSFYCFGHDVSIGTK